MQDLGHKITMSDLEQSKKHPGYFIVESKQCE